MPNRDIARIHASERDFFDSKASTQPIGYLDPRILHRYSGPLRSYLHNEFAISLAGDLSGKSVLDVGCGDGERSILFGRLGAVVTGIDISSGAIEVARARALKNGINATFIASPIETMPELSQFDIVWVEALLHHLLHDLDATVAKLVSFVAPAGRIIITEPVSLSPTLRRLRLKFGPAPDSTPDERPLEPADLAVIRKHLPGLQSRYFGILGRFANRLVPGLLEYASKPASLAFHAAHFTDRLLLGIPAASAAASIGVMWSKRPQP